DVYQEFCRANQILRAEITSNGDARTVCSLPDQQPGEPLKIYSVSTDQGVFTLAARPPLNLAQKQRNISNAVAGYRQLAVDKKNFRNLYVLLLSLITLFILFFATWIARYMATQISTALT